MEAYVEYETVIFPHRVQVNCSFCGSKKFRTKDKLDEWTIVQCECGYCYTNPRPPKEKLHLFYQEEYFSDERHAKKFFEEDGSSKIPQIDMNDARIIDIENWFTTRGKLLDIGAARGYFLRTMRARGWEVDGIEISSDAVAFAREHFSLDLFCGTIEDFPENEKFDAICMYQTLEHVHDPKLVLEKAFKMLNPGGVFVIEVPNIEAHDIKRNIERKRLQYDLPRHLNHFSPKILDRELRKSGFEVVYIDRYFPQFVIDYSNRKLKNPNIQATGNIASEEKKESGLPLKRFDSSWKLNLLKSVSQLYPGWRFTIISRKPV